MQIACYALKCCSVHVRSKNWKKQTTKYLELLGIREVHPTPHRPYRPAAPVGHEGPVWADGRASTDWRHHPCSWSPAHTPRRRPLPRPTLGLWPFHRAVLFVASPAARQSPPQSRTGWPRALPLWSVYPWFLCYWAFLLEYFRSTQRPFFCWRQLTNSSFENVWWKVIVLFGR